MVKKIDKSKIFPLRTEKVVIAGTTPVHLLVPPLPDGAHEYIHIIMEISTPVHLVASRITWDNIMKICVFMHSPPTMILTKVIRGV